MAHKTVRSAILSGILCLVAVTTTAANAAEDKIGETHMCVPLEMIASTPVIDDHTILIELRSKKYMRMDLVAPCFGLTMNYGFVHKTSTNDLCTTDALTINQAGGETCMIKQIVTISGDDAKRLLKEKK